MTYYIINDDGVTLDLGQIQSERYELDCDLDEQTFPTSGSKATQSFDYGGVKRHITLKGVLTGTSQQDLVDKCLKLDALLNGDQEIIPFHSDLIDTSTYTKANFDYTNGIIMIKVKNLDWEYVYGSVLLATYTIIMYESI